MSWYILLIALAVHLVVRFGIWMWVSNDPFGITRAYHTDHWLILTAGVVNTLSLVVGAVAGFVGLWSMI